MFCKWRDVSLELNLDTPFTIKVSQTQSKIGVQAFTTTATNKLFILLRIGISRTCKNIECSCSMYHHVWPVGQHGKVWVLLASLLFSLTCMCSSGHCLWRPLQSVKQVLRSGEWPTEMPKYVKELTSQKPAKPQISKDILTQKTQAKSSTVLSI